jgi:hypothetical protein
MLAAAYQLERLPAEWVEGMRDAHRDAGRADTNCSRRLCPIQWWTKVSGLFRRDPS